MISVCFTRIAIVFRSVPSLACARAVRASSGSNPAIKGIALSGAPLFLR